MAICHRNAIFPITQSKKCSRLHGVCSFLPTNRPAGNNWVSSSGIFRVGWTQIWLAIGANTSFVYHILIYRSFSNLMHHSLFICASFLVFIHFCYCLHLKACNWLPVWCVILWCLALMANRRYAQSTLGVCVCFIGDTWSVIKVNFSGRTTGQT